MSDKKKFSDTWLGGLFKNAADGAMSSVSGSLGSIFSGLFQNYQYKKLHEYQMEENRQVFQQNKDLAAYTNQLNIDQWNRENAYNSPSAQMARYSAAGLNPDLIYNQSNLSANSPTLSGGTPQNPTNLAAIKAAVTQQAAQIQNTFAQTKLLDAQARNINADTRQKNAGAEGQELENVFNADTFEDRKEMFFNQGEIIFNQMGISLEQKNILHKDYQKVCSEVLHFDEMLRTNIQNGKEDVITKQFAREMESKEFENRLYEFAEQMLRQDEKLKLDKEALNIRKQELAFAIKQFMWTMQYQRAGLQIQANESRARIRHMDAMNFGIYGNTFVGVLNGLANYQLTGAQILGQNINNLYNWRTLDSRVNFTNNSNIGQRLNYIQQGINILSVPFQFNQQGVQTLGSFFK